jgi:hypothetical protein
MRFMRALFSGACPVSVLGSIVAGFCPVLIGLSGCATVHSVSVDAFRSTKVTGGQSYIVVSRRPAKQAADPGFEEAVALVRSALEAKGMYEAAPPESAEVIVEFEYGVGQERIKVESMVGMDAVVGVSQPMGRYGGSTLPPVGPNPTPPSGSGQTYIVTRPTELREYAVYEKHLVITGHVAQRGKAGIETGPEIWRVEATLEDEKGEVDYYLPVLVAAASDYIGETTGKKIEVRIGDER